MKMRTLIPGFRPATSIWMAGTAYPAASGITGHAKSLRASVIVFKEFTVHDRPVLSCLKDGGGGDFSKSKRGRDVIPLMIVHAGW